MTPHQLRHTYITNLIYAAVDPKTVQYLAGHQNSKITMDIYAKVKYNKLEELASVVNSSFNMYNSPGNSRFPGLPLLHFLHWQGAAAFLFPEKAGIGLPARITVL